MFHWTGLWIEGTGTSWMSFNTELDTISLR
jgi:hypothetical protein